MAAQGSAPAALDETASQVDDTIDDDVTDLSESEDDGFESEYDTIADQFFWNGVPWSVLADNTRLNRLNPWQDVDDDDPLLHKNRAKRDGSNRWVRYVPEWTDPDYDEKWEVLEVTDDEPMRRRRGVGDVYQRLRPALRPLDVLRNPTEWARRYGIHPDQGDGRSRMTPVKAGGRRFHLNGLRTTPDGQQKTFLDMGDLDAAEREFHRSGGAEMGLTYLQGLEQLATRDPEAPEAEIAAGLLTLLGGIARDEFHQRHMFPGHTTDELLQRNVLDISGNVDSDLAGPLHPFFIRDRWFTSEGLGDNASFPLLYYNLDNLVGEWSAQNDTVWAALQPALQLATRVLNAQPKAWDTLADLYTRVRIDRWYDNRSDKTIDRTPYGKYRYAMWPDDPEPEDLFPELRRLWDLGFDWKAAVNDLLQDRLRIFIGRARAGVEGEDDFHGDTCGWTTIREIGVTKILDNSVVRVQISAELVWPLLSSAFTAGEKAMASFGVAATLLHELAHAVTFSQWFMVSNAKGYVKSRKDAHLISDDVTTALDALREHFGHHPTCEPIWQTESQAEAGYIFENQLWGGLVEGLIDRRTAPHSFVLQFTTTTLSVWPKTRECPHDGGSLTDTTSSTAVVDSWQRPLPVRAIRSLFSESFWKTTIPRYGLAALRLDNQIPIISIEPVFRRRREFAREFGKQSGTWMWSVRAKLMTGGYHVIAEYLDHLVRARLGPLWSRKRWHYERKRWPDMDTECLSIKRRVGQAGSEFTKAFQLLTAPRETTVAILDQRNAEWTRQALLQGIIHGAQPTLDDVERSVEEAATKQFDELLSALRAAYTFLWNQVQYLQGMAFQYAQDPPDVRLYLQANYGHDLCDRIENSLEGLCANSIMILTKCYDGLRGANRVPDGAQVAVESLAGRFANIRTLLGETVAFLEGPAGEDSELFRDGWEAKLSVVQPDTQARRLERIKTLALREYQRLPGENPVVMKVVDIFHSILARKSDLKFDAFRRKAPELEDVIKKLRRVRQWRKRKPLPSARGEKVPGDVGGGKGIFQLPDATQATIAQQDKVLLPLPRFGFPVAAPVPSAQGMRQAPLDPVFVPGQGGGNGFAQYGSLSGFAGVPQGASVLTAPPGGVPPTPAPVPIGPPLVGPPRPRPFYQHRLSTRQFPMSSHGPLDTDLAELHQLLGRAAYREYTKFDDVEAIREMLELTAAMGQTWPQETLLDIFQGKMGPGRHGYGPNFIIPATYLPSGVPASTVAALTCVGPFDPPPPPRDFGSGFRPWNPIEAEEAELARIEEENRRQQDALAQSMMTGAPGTFVAPEAVLFVPGSFPDDNAIDFTSAFFTPATQSAPAAPAAAEDPFWGPEAPAPPQ